MKKLLIFIILILWSGISFADCLAHRLEDKRKAEEEKRRNQARTQTRIQTQSETENEDFYYEAGNVWNTRDKIYTELNFNPDDWSKNLSTSIATEYTKEKNRIWLVDEYQTGGSRKKFDYMNFGLWNDIDKREEGFLKSVYGFYHAVSGIDPSDFSSIPRNATYSGNWIADVKSGNATGSTVFRSGKAIVNVDLSHSKRITVDLKDLVMFRKKIVECNNEFELPLYDSVLYKKGGLEMKFFGPNAEEVGGAFDIWKDHSKDERVIGSFGARRD